MNEDREKTLPKWAQEIIAELRHRLKTDSEQAIKELNRLRPRVEFLEAKNNGLMELLGCAAKGGHMTAQEICSLLDGYELQLAAKY